VTFLPATGFKKRRGIWPNYSNPGERALEILGGELIYTKSINIIAICFSCQVAHRSRESLVPAHTSLTRKFFLTGHGGWDSAMSWLPESELRLHSYAGRCKRYTLSATNFSCQHECTLSVLGDNQTREGLLLTYRGLTTLRQSYRPWRPIYLAGKSRSKIGPMRLILRWIHNTLRLSNRI
jgi:hypothetical protein